MPTAFFTHPVIRRLIGTMLAALAMTAVVAAPAVARPTVNVVRSAPPPPPAAAATAAALHLPPVTGHALTVKPPAVPERAAKKAAAPATRCPSGARPVRGTRSCTTGKASAAVVARLKAVERTADRMPFRWRESGVVFIDGCHPKRSRCPWASYDGKKHVIYVSWKAHADTARLRYTLAHEITHAWQWTHDMSARKQDLARYGYTGMDGIERAADCMAASWGYRKNIYWTCPASAARHMGTVFARNQ